MSPATEDATADHEPRVTLDALAAKQRSGTPLVMVTAYDFPSAQAIEESGAVDLVLAGDTGAEMVLGFSGTAQVSLEEMLVMTAAVRHGSSVPARRFHGCKRSRRPGSPSSAHLGLTPHSETALGGRRAQGRSAEQAIRLQCSDTIEDPELHRFLKLPDA